MSKYYLAIPAIIGIAAGLFATVYFANPQKPQSDFTLQQLLNAGSPPHGSALAPITIIEFGDYQCTFCYKFHQSSLDTLAKEYVETGKARLVFVDFPLNGEDSVLAAEAAHCANEQGKFWEYHNELYNNWGGERTGWVNKQSLTGFAHNVEMNLEKFNDCLNSGKYRQQVINTYEFGQKIGINATPSFLIIAGDKIVKITGNQPIDVFRKTLDSM
ncbi:MAG TPA: thioredoxin domain-containing protein [Candidatus Nitrosotenuis sp.]|nr:thioredoxin domain-containing protein [Candidatus Nitrosotenuis sp.]